MAGHIALVTDGSTELDGACRAIAARFPVRIWKGPNDGSEDGPAPSLIVVCLDLRDAKAANRYLSVEPYRDKPSVRRLFVVPTDSPEQFRVAVRLKATKVISADKGDDDVCLVIRRMVPHVTYTAPKVRSTAQVAAESYSVFESLNTRVRNGGDFTPEEVSAACTEIVDSIRDGGIRRWLTEVNRHHSYTFRHSLHVTGLVIACGAHLGFAERDIKRFGIAGMLHDIGKAYIPLKILDKPGPLTPNERAVVEKHPVHGSQILIKNGRFEQMIVDLASQHHELLDGSGYPEGLSGDAISDPVRLLTICDIFSALVDKRAYKQGMTPDKALKIMLNMGGKIDQSFLQACDSVLRTAAATNESEMAA